MSGNFGDSSSIQPLSVGNVVSAGLRLYRSHLKDYFLIAFKAYLWVLIPVYGWAKFYALTALISRLAFGELVNQPESISSGERFVNSRLWQFLSAMILVGLISIGVFFGVGIVFGVLGAIAAGFIRSGSNPADIATTSIIVGLIFIVLGIAALVGIFWFLTRFYLVSIHLAIEDNMYASASIGRSWELTKGYVWRIMLIGFVAFLITIPIQIFVQIASTIIQLVLTPLMKDGSGVYSLLFLVLVLGISFTSGALIVPFWKTIQAVIYYDLRSRREGLGLKLRDRGI